MNASDDIDVQSTVTRKFWSNAMSSILHFTGFIKGVTYKACLTTPLKRISFADFDPNETKASGVIQVDNTEVAYSKWLSPKRSRSYPFARVYDTCNSARILTIIPVIKDEGKDGELDKIQYSTVSWMNLLNTYIVLGYYEYAEKSNKKDQVDKEKLTNQRFNSEFIKLQIQEIINYKQSALHWNKNLFEERFVSIFQQALDSYKAISDRTNVQINSHAGVERYLQAVVGDFEEFKNLSLKGSQNASKREAATSHELEYLVDGKKSTFCIENYLGGVYYLTPDEIVHGEEGYIIQESKNSKKEALPKLGDIKDGLFKLILYSNISSLQLNDQEVNFSTKLKLTGVRVRGRLILPCSSEAVKEFLRVNADIFKRGETRTIQNLLLETQQNKKIQIEISANH